MKKLFRCTICGYVHEGLEAPEVCPKCSLGKEKFVELTNEEATKIYTADRTNSIHAELIVLADKRCPTHVCDGGLVMGNLRRAAH